MYNVLKMLHIQPADGNGSSDGKNGAAQRTVVHDKAAAIPGHEGPDGEGDAVAAHSQALGEALAEAELDGALEGGGEPGHGLGLANKGVDGADGGDGLLGYDAGLVVLEADLHGHVHEHAAVDEAGNKEYKEEGQCYQRHPP